jgi:hypothetical protein
MSTCQHAQHKHFSSIDQWSKLHVIMKLNFFKGMYMWNYKVRNELWIGLMIHA